jgi:hypothetical protein
MDQHGSKRVPHSDVSNQPGPGADDESDILTIEIDDRLIKKQSGKATKGC